MEIEFLRPEWLGLFLILPFLIYSHFFVFRRLKKRAFLFANFETLKRVTGQGFIGSKKKTFVSKNLFLLALRVFSFSVLILAVSGILFSYKADVLGGSFVIALDTSSSMLANDFEPDRITAAKDAIILMLTSMGSRMNAGLVTFAGISMIQNPITDKRDELLSAIEKVKIMRSGGTDLTQAIITSVNVLAGEKNKQKAIILITDGRSTVGSPIEQAIEYAIDQNVVINTVGMATKEGGAFLNLESLSSLDDVTLKMIANETQGRYFHAGSPQELVFKLENALETQKTDQEVDLSWWFIAAGFLVLFIEWMLSNTKYRSIP